MQQRDWLQLTPFSARYIDSMMSAKKKKGKTFVQTQKVVLIPERNGLQDTRKWPLLFRQVYLLSTGEYSVEAIATMLKKTVALIILTVKTLQESGFISLRIENQTEVMDIPMWKIERSRLSREASSRVKVGRFFVWYRERSFAFGGKICYSMTVH